MFENQNWFFYVKEIQYCICPEGFTSLISRCRGAQTPVLTIHPEGTRWDSGRCFIMSKEKLRRLNDLQVCQKRAMTNTTSVQKQSDRKKIAPRTSDMPATVNVENLGWTANRPLMAMSQATALEASGCWWSEAWMIASWKCGTVGRIVSLVTRPIMMMKFPEAFLDGPNYYRPKSGHRYWICSIGFQAIVLFQLFSWLVRRTEHMKLLCYGSYNFYEAPHCRSQCLHRTTVLVQCLAVRKKVR